MTSAAFESAVVLLQRCLDAAKKGHPNAPEFLEIVEARDAVLARFQAVFSDEHLDDLTEQEFREFLHFKNNCHWKALHRKGGVICHDLPRLRNALRILFDESRPIVDRLNELVRVGKPNYIPNLGRAILTPLLLVRYPDRYGVWNNVAQQAMTDLGLWPSFDPKLPFGDRYIAVNQIITEIADRIGTDLWTLDALWWVKDRLRDEPPYSGEQEGEEESDGPSTSCEKPARFYLERHLHDFLRDNWDNTELGKEWSLYEEDGEPDAGYEYPTEVGPIDLLARHKTEPRWLVVELKRNQSSDKSVGQVLRYMGWVKESLAAPDDSVEGLVISHAADKRIEYALKSVPAVSLKLYEVSFHLRDT